MGSDGCDRWHKNLRIDKSKVPTANPSLHVDTASLDRPASEIQVKNLGTRHRKRHRKRSCRYRSHLGCWDRLRTEIGTRHYLISFESAYVDLAKRFICFHADNVPCELATGISCSVLFGLVFSIASTASVRESLAQNQVP
jgi:hypothetical protein